MGNRYDDDDYGRRPSRSANRPANRSSASGRRTSGSQRRRDDYEYGYEDDYEYGYEDDYEYDDYEDTRKSRKSGSGRSSSGRSVDRRSSGSRSSSSRPSGKKKLSAKQKAKKRRNRIIIFSIEIIALAVVLFILYGVTKVEKVGHVDLSEADIEVNEEVAENVSMKGYRTIALFGVDSTTGALTKNTRSDTIIIANIDNDNKQVKLVSVYRDTYLNIGNDTYNKCNGAYAKGGPQQAINMLNQNLDLNITDFVTIGFEGLATVVDSLGGVTLDVGEEEISHLNNYQMCIAENLKTTYTPVQHSGVQTLNGLQATAYCRIRYTKGDDFKRAERQRTILKLIMDQAHKASKTTLASTCTNVFDSKVIYTSLNLEEALSLLADISSYNIVGDEGFPEASMRGTGTVGSKGSCVIPKDLTSNVTWLHEYLFDETGYEPSSEVKSISSKVSSDTSGAK